MVLIPNIKQKNAVHFLLMDIAGLEIGVTSSIGAKMKSKSKGNGAKLLANIENCSIAFLHDPKLLTCFNDIR